MKYVLLLFLSVYCLEEVQACDCKSVSVEKGYETSNEVVLGKVIKAERKTHVLSPEIRDSIQHHYRRFVYSDTIPYMEYTVQVITDYKSTRQSTTLIVRAEADKSNCDIRLMVGHTYMLYGFIDEWTDLYYPQDRYFVRSSRCTRTTINWEKERQLVEAYLQRTNAPLLQNLLNQSDTEATQNQD